MRVSPLVAGLIGGFVAALLQAFFNVFPPPAYGVCIACHTRDLVNWIVNNLFGSSLGLAPVSKAFPVLTVVGIFIGAFIAANAHKEFKLKETHNPIVGFVLGILVIIFALLMGGCPLRETIRTAYGDIIAFISLIAMFIGVIVASEVYLKRKAW
ncbi:cytochrome C [Methanocaldococcus infernus]